MTPVTHRIELRCSRDLALRLGAIAPGDAVHQRALMDGPTLTVRDRATGLAMYWPWELSRDEVTGRASS